MAALCCGCPVYFSKMKLNGVCFGSLLEFFWKGGGNSVALKKGGYLQEIEIHNASVRKETKKALEST